LPACKKVNPLATFSVVVDIRSTSNASCPTSAIAQFVKQQRWQMLKLLERQQILTLFAPATRFEEG
jgi:hypothetical protein